MAAGCRQASPAPSLASTPASTRTAAGRSLTPPSIHSCIHSFTQLVRSVQIISLTQLPEHKVYVYKGSRRAASEQEGTKETDRQSQASQPTNQPGEGRGQTPQTRMSQSGSRSMQAGSRVCVWAGVYMETWKRVKGGGAGLLGAILEGGCLPASSCLLCLLSSTDKNDTHVTTDKRRRQTQPHTHTRTDGIHTYRHRINAI